MLRVPTAARRLIVATSIVAVSVTSFDLQARAQTAQAPPNPAVRPAPSSTPPPRDPLSTAAAGSGVVRGRVTDSESGRPLRRARINLTSPALGRESRTANTSADGKYEIKDLPAGRYTLTVTRSGYLQIRYGQRRPYEQGKPLELADKEIVERVDFLLPRTSVISGRVVDDLGEPIEGVTMLVMRSMFVAGRQQLVPTGSSQYKTDDSGAYRLSGLSPGTYLVQARSSERWIVDTNGRTETMGYSPTYYPGTDRLSEATAVTVALGKEMPGIDFTLIPGRSAKISGTAFDSGGRPFRRVSLGQEIRGDNFASFGGMGGGSSVVGLDGSFSISNITPGDYKLSASTNDGTPVPGAALEVAIMRLTVDGSDIEGIHLTGSSGGTVTGTIVTDDGSAVPRTSRLTLLERVLGQPDPNLLSFKNFGVAEIAENGVFTINNVFGPARFELTPATGWALKSIRLNGDDIEDRLIEPKHGEELSGVQIVLTNRLTTVNGRLSSDKGPATEGWMVVFPANAERWVDNSRMVKAARLDQSGRSQIKGLPPGEYLAAGVDYVEEGAWFNPKYLESLRDSATRFTLAAAGTQDLSLRIQNQ